MKFDLLTMIALLGSASLLSAIPSMPRVVFAVQMLVIPIAMMLIAITSPKQGTSLNVRARWYFFLLGKTWCFTAVGFVVIALVVAAFPDLIYRFSRLASGDFRSRVMLVEVELGQLTRDDFKGTVTPIFDERGLVGECRQVSQLVSFASRPGAVLVRDCLYISTDLDSGEFDESALYYATRQSDGRIFLRLSQ